MGKYLLFTNWVQGPYQEIQAQDFSYSPSLRGLFEKPRLVFPGTARVPN